MTPGKRKEALPFPRRFLKSFHFKSFFMKVKAEKPLSLSPLEIGKG